MSAPTASAPAEAAAVVPLRANREFRLLWVGQALSDFGSGLSFIVLPLVLLAAGYSTSAAGVLGTATLLTAMAVRIPAGYLSDRFDQRRLMALCDLAGLLLVGAVAVCVLVGSMPIALALAAVIGTQAASEVFRPSQNVVIRRIIPTDQLGRAVSLNQARAYAAAIVAPAAAGFLFAFSPGVPFAVDAATFGVSALCIVALARSRVAGPRVVRDGEQERFSSRVTAGLRHMVRDRFLRSVSAYCTLVNLVFQTLVYALILGVGRTSGGAATVGIVMSSAAVTGLAGSLVAPLVQRRLRFQWLMATGPVVSAVLLGVAWKTGSPIAFGGAFAALCMLTPLVGVVLSTVMATAAPEAIYGRVTTAFGFTAEVLQPTGPLLAGLLLARTSLSGTAALLAGAYAVLAVMALSLPAPPAVPAGD